MRLEHAFIIGKREYLTRVKGKGFWIATIALPAFIAIMMVGPTLLMTKASSEQRLAVVDATGGGLGERLKAALAGEQKDRRGGAGAIRFDVQVLPPAAGAAAQRAELDRQVLAKKIDAWIWLDSRGLASNEFEYHAESVANFITQSVLSRKVSTVVNQWRLQQAGYDSARIASLTVPLEPRTERVSKTGSRAEGGLGGFFLAFALFFMLYMVIVIYGQQIMQGVIEEKSSRVVEVLASAVKPTELMAGKMGGICLVALTQLAIWMATLAVLTAPGILASLVVLPADARLPTLAPVVVINFFVFFLLGFLLFATIYGMIGASFNSVQEAQQVAAIAVVLVVAPALFLMPVINAPDSRLAVIASLIPFFTPLVMMLRIAVKTPPLWQIATSYVLTTATISAMVWLCARVYRVGILMYGKKPTLQEIVRWVRYS
jgi:ABC-2 type transport system permease protein